MEDAHVPARRRYHRLEGYDYSQVGVYFLTIVTRDRELIFEDADLNRIIESQWLWLADRYPHVRLDEFVVMPNHLHGIVFIDSKNEREMSSKADAGVKGVGRLVAAFKTVSTQAINKQRGTSAMPSLAAELL